MPFINHPTKAPNLDELRAENTTLKAKIEKLDIQIAALKTVLEELDGEIKRERATDRGRMTRLEKKHATLDKRVAVIEATPDAPNDAPNAPQAN